MAHTFHGNHTRDWDLAMDHVSKKWPSIMEPLFEIGMNSMAVVVDLRASTEGLALNETDVIAGMLQSHLRSDLADCELRLAYAKEQRFYANITFSSYRDLHLTGQGGSITSSSISDHGFAIKIDVNTKLASLSNLAELQRFGPKDFDALLSLCHEVFRARIPEILGGD
ncbi:MAG: hypothetical protein HY791_26825 [Deltaproteobacteria bacterium]|nr:hypothetical protein [Deltaproteobacteria bacterium]